MKFDPAHICSSNLDFKAEMHEIFLHQVEKNQIYKSYIDGLVKSQLIGQNAFDFQSDLSTEFFLNQIPLLPVEAFRDAKIYTESEREHDLLFQSSGTTNSARSKHYVAYKSQYESAIFNGLKEFYDVEHYVFLAYTPGYLSNPNSSLVWMLNALINRDETGLSRFLEIGNPLDPVLLNTITQSGRQLMLFGAAFGLIEMVEKFPIELPPNSIVMETGGMKTYRKEITRADLHHLLAKGFGLKPDQIHSEYGMTELLSQAYSLGDMWFRTPPWMKISIRNKWNPLESVQHGQEGMIGVIDLANWASCPFLLTGDLGIQREDGAFQVLGRWSKYHLRGCNFLLEED